MHISVIMSIVKFMCRVDYVQRRFNSVFGWSFVREIIADLKYHTSKLSILDINSKSFKNDRDFIGIF